MLNTGRSLRAISGPLLGALTALAVFGFSALLAAEVAFRLSAGDWYFRKNTDGEAHLPEASRIRPDGSLHPRLVQAYRRPFRLEKLTSFRILIIGGSTSYGSGVAEPATWPSLLETRLNSAQPGQFEVVNLGLPGGNLREQLLNSRSMQVQRNLRDRFFAGADAVPGSAPPGWLDLAPDLVILAPQVNDVAPDLLDLLQARSARFAHRWLRRLDQSRLAGKLALTHLVRRALRRQMDSHPPAIGGLPLPGGAIAQIRDEMGRNLETLIDLWAGKAKIVLVKFPTLFDPADSDADRARAEDDIGTSKQSLDWPTQEAVFEAAEAADQKTLEEVSAARKIPYACIRCDLLKERITRRARLFLDAVNLGAEGQVLIAEALESWLRAESLLPPQPEAPLPH